jgi:tetratricopeptide (TPR) repeat protein
VKPRTWRVIALACVGFFALQVLSYLLLPLGGIFTRFALLTRPLDGEARLKAVRRDQNLAGENWKAADISSALARLQGGIRRNPFNYLAQFERFQLLQKLESLGEGTSDEVLQAMRTTLSLRWKDLDVSMAGMRFAFSRWPFLSAEDRTFFIDVFTRMTGVMSRNVFPRILETWGRYSRDLQLLKAALQQRPEFNLEAAKVLAGFQFHPRERIGFLARYEAWAVDHYGKEFEKRIREGQDNYDTWEYVANRLEKAIEGYSRMVPATAAAFLEFGGIMDQLQLKMVAALTGSMEWMRRPASRKEIIRLADTMAERPADRSILGRLAERLQNTRFFATFDKNPDVLEMRMRVLLGAGEAGSAAMIGAKVAEERHYIPPEEKESLRRIFVLYAEALREQEKIAEAVRVIDLARERTGGDESLEWMAYRLTNPGEIDAESENWQKLPQAVRESFRITLKPGATVYIVYPSPGNEIVVAVPLDTAEILQNTKLVQLWVNGWIFAEKYTGDLEPGQEWRLPLPDNPDKEPIRVRVVVK